MTVQYDGNPTGVQAPAVAPAFGQVPAVMLPEDTDPPNGSTWEQAYKVLADYVAFLMTARPFGPWGYSLTDASIAADTDLIAGNVYYRDLTIGAGKILTMVHPGIVFVSGVLTFTDAASKIVFGKKAGGLNGNNAGASTRGVGGVGSNGDSFGQLLGGGNGGAGGDDTHLNPIAGDGVGDAGVGGWGGGGGGLGGAGGAGGAGAHAAGIAGTMFSFFSSTAEEEAMALYQILLNHGWGFARKGSDAVRTAIPFGIQGGCGGGGGGGTATNTATAGGGGGAGGSVGLVIARSVVGVTDGCIQAPGGNGGNGFAAGEAAGGGGAGGGGFVGLVYAQKTGAALTAANCCPAGTPGTGANGGAAGGAGAVGNVREYQVGY